MMTSFSLARTSRLAAWLATAFLLSASPSMAQPSGGQGPVVTHSELFIVNVGSEGFPSEALAQLVSVVMSGDRLLKETLGEEQTKLGAHVTVSAVADSDSMVVIMARLMAPENVPIKDEQATAVFQALKKRIQDRLIFFYEAHRQSLKRQLDQLVGLQEITQVKLQRLRHDTAGPHPEALLEALNKARADLAQAQMDQELQEARRVALMKSIAEAKVNAVAEAQEDPVSEQLKRIVKTKTAMLARTKTLREKNAVSLQELLQREEELASAESELRLRQAEVEKTALRQDLSEELARLTLAQRDSEVRRNALSKRFEEMQAEVDMASRTRNALDLLARLERSLARLDERIDDLRMRMELMSMPEVIQSQ